jgi:hypothetical protein
MHVIRRRNQPQLRNLAAWGAATYVAAARVRVHTWVRVCALCRVPVVSGKDLGTPPWHDEEGRWEEGGDEDNGRIC